MMHHTSNLPVKMELDALRIYPGATIYIQSQSDGLRTRHKVQFIGTIFAIFIQKLTAAGFTSVSDLRSYPKMMH
jgi:hypothetical protein